MVKEQAALCPRACQSVSPLAGPQGRSMVGREHTKEWLRVAAPCFVAQRRSPGEGPLLWEECPVAGPSVLQTAPRATWRCVEARGVESQPLPRASPSASLQPGCCDVGAFHPCHCPFLMLDCPGGRAFSACSGLKPGRGSSMSLPHPGAGFHPWSLCCSWELHFLETAAETNMSPGAARSEGPSPGRGPLRQPLSRGGQSLP